MDLKHHPTKIPDHESETPPHSQPINLLSFANGKPHHHTPPHTAAATYKECLKNHAVAIGGHTLDGCGEFMPSPTYNPTEPSSFKCVACSCHRNFHLREPTNDYPAIRTRSLASPPSEPKNYAFGQHLLLLSTAAEHNHVATPGWRSKLVGESGSGLNLARNKRKKC
ncbi:hypothetical protein L1987_69116 [Smallanthus sonchifolius]|uniref:Uncharacterized protein n=1 Tax=Smallanthus sonchifolius TaxID=185202 RepID=A0ACB9B5X6_9ASTR|nr:hypothetical protein L1987_69116 [Smallanthus sonchifolius]